MALRILKTRASIDMNAFKQQTQMRSQSRTKITDKLTLFIKDHPTLPPIKTSPRIARRRKTVDMISIKIAKAKKPARLRAMSIIQDRTFNLT
jgi:hypothetical protein